MANNDKASIQQPSEQGEDLSRLAALARILSIASTGSILCDCQHWAAS